MRLSLLFIWLLLIGCSYSGEDIVGLWQLEKVEKDGFIKVGESQIKGSGLTILEIRSNNSFAVSKTSGDLVGVYKLIGNRLELHSYDDSWFNTNWEMSSANQILELHGLEVGYGNVFLRFKKIDKIPDFSEFEDKVTGNWQLYKIRKEHRVQKLDNTYFMIGDDGSYILSENSQVLEQGKLLINPRHHKVTFEHDNETWDAWFYGEELRLTNEKIGIEYSLRQAPNIAKN
ncbi:MAG: hypothetical protein ACFHWX_21990 [Bacteroidota bacterium]